MYKHLCPTLPPTLHHSALHHIYLTLNYTSASIIKHLSFPINLPRIMHQHKHPWTIMQLPMHLHVIVLQIGKHWLHLLLQQSSPCICMLYFSNSYTSCICNTSLSSDSNSYVVFIHVLFHVPMTKHLLKENSSK